MSTTLAVPAGLDHAFAFTAFKDDPRPTREIERLFTWLDDAATAAGVRAP